MKILKHQLKPLFIQAVASAYPQLKEGELLEIVTVEDPRDVAHGDYACPAAFKLSKILGKAPREIGEAIVDNFPDDMRVGSVEFVNPGFVNLRLSTAFLEESLKQLEQGFSVEAEDVRKAPVIVEYPSTNAAKHMGVHHILTTMIGNALANLFEYMGWEVIRVNHLGDWGTNAGMLIYAVEEWGDRSVIHKDPNNELSKLYVRFNEEAETRPELQDEARKIFKSLEDGDEERCAMWDWIVSESIQDLEKVLKRLNASVDHHIGERFYLERAEAVIEEGIEKGVFVEGEKGALIFEMGEDQVPALIRKGDGTTLYLTRDIATIQYRMETWHPESIVYVVGHAQSLHFQQNFKVARALGYDQGAKLEHIAFGQMRFADRKMSSRKGNVLKLEEMLDDAVTHTQDFAKKHQNEFTDDEFAALCEIVGVSAVKYAILSQDRMKDIIFDWSKMITLEGNSAPYLMYSYARAKRVVEKVGDLPLSGLPRVTEEVEIELLRKMLKFPQVLEHALEERKPHIIATFLYELCGEFNRFYVGVRVADAETELQKRSRSGLVQAFMHQLKAGLAILSIPTVDRM